MEKTQQISFPTLDESLTQPLTTQQQSFIYHPALSGKTGRRPYFPWIIGRCRRLHYFQQSKLLSYGELRIKYGSDQTSENDKRRKRKYKNKQRKQNRGRKGLNNQKAPDKQTVAGSTYNSALFRDAQETNEVPDVIQDANGPSLPMEEHASCSGERGEEVGAGLDSDQHSDDSERTIRAIDSPMVTSADRSRRSSTSLSEPSASPLPQSASFQDKCLSTILNAQSTASMADESGYDSSRSSTPTPAPPPPSFRFDDLDPRSRCRLPDCRKMTSCHDGTTKWCPACGPKSYIRYCSQDHLYQDLRRHHASDCCKHAITYSIDEATILLSQQPGRPYLGHDVFSIVPPSSHLGSFERHRQAVYLCMEATGQYFLFNNHGECIHRIIIPQTTSSDPCRAMFRWDLSQVLTFGVNTFDRQLAMIRVVAAIRQSLVNDLLWTNQWMHLLYLQILLEFGWRVPDVMRKL